MNSTTLITTSIYNLWNYPILIKTEEVDESIEMIYQQTSKITTLEFPPKPPEIRIYKIIYSCVNGKWNKSEPIFGKIIPACEETYEFEN